MCDGGRGPRSYPSSCWMLGREGLLVCELSSSVSVTLNVTPNHTWLSGFPWILSGLFGVSGEGGTCAIIILLLAQYSLMPLPHPCSCLLSALRFRSRIGRMVGGRVEGTKSGTRHPRFQPSFMRPTFTRPSFCFLSLKREAIIRCLP